MTTNFNCLTSHLLELCMFIRYVLHFYIVLEIRIDSLLRPKHVAVLDKGSTVFG